jgi:sec-independent protein translocase protein TatA
MFGLSELAVILVVVIAVLVAKKGPELARSAGKSARILKAETRAMKEEQNRAETETAPQVVKGNTIPPAGALRPAQVSRLRAVADVVQNGFSTHEVGTAGSAPAGMPLTATCTTVQA